MVDADLDIPDQLPDPTENATYDPYYVRVVFLNTLTCYNMSIIVPSMVRDQYGNFALQGTAYQNVLSKTDELDIGYLYSLYDSANNFDNLTFNPYPATIELAASPVATVHLHQQPLLNAANQHFQPDQPFRADPGAGSGGRKSRKRDRVIQFVVDYFSSRPHASGLLRVPPPELECGLSSHAGDAARREIHLFGVRRRRPGAVPA